MFNKFWWMLRQRFRLNVAWNIISGMLLLAICSAFITYSVVVNSTGRDLSWLRLMNFMARPKIECNRFEGFHETSCKAFLQTAQCQKQLQVKKSNHKWPTLNSTENFMDFRRVLLVIHYNEPMYENAAKINALYEGVFAKIVFCGPNNDKTAFWPHTSNESEFTLPLSVPFVAYGQNFRYKLTSEYLNSANNADIMYLISMEHPYICLPYALDAAPGDYDGAVVMSDDVILNYWNAKHFGKSLDKNWYMKEHNRNFAFDIDSTNFCVIERKSTGNSTADCHPNLSNWMWPKLSREKLLSFYNELILLGKEFGSYSDSLVVDRTPVDWLEYWHAIKSNLTKVTGGERRLLGQQSGDLFYVAKRFLPNIVPLLRVMGKHRVFLEIGVATALETVSGPGDIQAIKVDGHDWGDGHIRDLPFIDAYSTSYEMVHPFKMSNLMYYLGGETRNARAKAPSVQDSCVYCNLIAISSAYCDFFGKNTQI